MGYLNWLVECKPAKAQLVEHMTADVCSNQMAPGSRPGGRTRPCSQQKREAKAMSIAEAQILRHRSAKLLVQPEGVRRNGSTPDFQPARCAIDSRLAHMHCPYCVDAQFVCLHRTLQF